jgi:hypothetical protein
MTAQRPPEASCARPRPVDHPAADTGSHGARVHRSERRWPGVQALDSSRLSGFGQQLTKSTGLFRRQGRRGGDDRRHM